LNFFWWADDGDNVYEEGEQQISNGVQSLMSLAPKDGSFSVALADSEHNVWNPNAPAPIPGNKTVYIAKAWCFGTLTLTPVAAGQGQNPSIDPGVSCDGTTLNNITQTDGATLDVAFRAVQSRNNPNFLCGGEKPRLATITVVKVVKNDNGGNNFVPDFQLFVDNGVVTVPVTSSISTQVSAGVYGVSETGVSGYEASYSGDCDSEGNVTLNPGDNKTCTITNDDLPSNIHLVQNIINDNPGHTNATSGSYKLRIDGVIRPNNSSTAVISNTAHTISADPVSGYTASISGDIKCPALLGGNTTLDEGEVVNCTITFDEN
jgi:hypothetical protein